MSFSEQMLVDCDGSDYGCGGEKLEHMAAPRLGRAALAAILTPPSPPRCRCSLPGSPQADSWTTLSSGKRRRYDIAPLRSQLVCSVPLSSQRNSNSTTPIFMRLATLVVLQGGLCTEDDYAYTSGTSGRASDCADNTCEVRNMLSSTDTTINPQRF
ncbi:hypothetical protein TL16_g12824 [Triparma laevis f. inornata]|uniref:Uncharacterized protein n=1 Tax=Triparma laevis f. inornata TaxID=1714386 RepID=A0A9W7BU56_9STRA|nr:hypothetical protein TL16_g12824 [Triparma laevis f. inornata]